MNTCPTCGHETVTVTWSAETFIDAAITSANAHRVNGRDRVARALYQKERDAWIWRFKTATWDVDDGSAASTAVMTIGEDRIRRRVTFTRHYTGRAREMDRANVIGGMKPVLDAMVRVGLLVDDSPKWLDDRYEQKRSDRNGLHVLIEDVE